jgi:hypothetical protein
VTTPPAGVARHRPFALVRAWVAAVAAVVLARLVVSTAVVAAGVRAISDDDFARVTIAQRFAAAPTLDPSGTCWGRRSRSLERPRGSRAWLRPSWCFWQRLGSPSPEVLLWRVPCWLWGSLTRRGSEWRPFPTTQRPRCWSWRWRLPELRALAGAWLARRVWPWPRYRATRRGPLPRRWPACGCSMRGAAGRALTVRRAAVAWVIGRRRRWPSSGRSGGSLTASCTTTMRGSSSRG